MAILWKDDYSSGMTEIDDQHKKLFGFVNELEKIIDRGIYDGPEIDNLFMFLGTYTKTHFAFEEICMRRVSCPSAEKNKDAHGKFLDFFTQIQTEYQSDGGSEPLLRKLQHTAENWLDSHICKVDIHLRSCAAKITKKIPPM